MGRTSSIRWHLSLFLSHTIHWTTQKRKDVRKSNEFGNLKKNFLVTWTLSNLSTRRKFGQRQQPTKLRKGEKFSIVAEKQNRKDNSARLECHFCFALTEMRYYCTEHKMNIRASKSIAHHVTRWLWKSKRKLRLCIGMDFGSAERSRINWYLRRYAYRPLIN